MLLGGIQGKFGESRGMLGKFGESQGNLGKLGETRGNLDFFLGVRGSPGILGDVRGCLGISGFLRGIKNFGCEAGSTGYVIHLFLYISNRFISNQGSELKILSNF